MDIQSPPQDDFKWFGEGFDGFPKRLPDDCVEYAVYVIDQNLHKQADVRARLKQFQRAASDLGKKLLKGYIWQRDAFSLELEHEDGTPLLRGRTNFGDSVADEWMIVYLLRELSRQFPDAWIRIFDNDGEFLLIEAANVLPKWLNPEVAENRVWMNSGSLKIIPRQQPQSPTPRTIPATRALSIQEAQSFLYSHRSSLIHSPLIESEAFYRLRDYPAQIHSSFHTALITIPRTLAYILQGKPAYISPAVEAFYLRDPISLRPLQAKSVVGLLFPPQDMVTVAIKFTKVGFAQLKSQEFAAPASWLSALAQTAETAEKDRARKEMGMKVACGFEMLVSDPQNQDKPAVREIRLLLSDLEDDPQLLPSDNKITQWSHEEDDESWLDVNFQDFEQELAGRSRVTGATPEVEKTEGHGQGRSGFGDKAAQENLRKMVERFQAFLNDEEARGDDSDGRDDMDVDDDDDDQGEDEGDEDNVEDSEGEDKDVSFDEVEFARMMHEMMGMPSEEGVEKPSLAHNGAAAARTRKDDLEGVDLGGLRNAGKRLSPIKSNDEDEDGDESETMREIMQRMEAELREAGALNLEPRLPKGSKDQSKRKAIKDTSQSEDEIEEDHDDASDVDIDINLAINLLESFKAQGGLAGPVGNMMGLFGLKMPRDDEGEHG